jgi:2-oxoglutarate dehydrogenase E2 component (dihydrolipoamide succinyltransferase)
LTESAIESAVGSGIQGQAAGIAVVMPQMGESITEGTIIKWLNDFGDRVELDEPHFEISTEKVDAEIPSPASGILREIFVQEGATVTINTVLALIAEGNRSIPYNSIFTGQVFQISEQ